MMNLLRKLVFLIVKWKRVFKKNIILVFLLLSGLFLFNGCTVESPEENYYVRKTSKKIKINGKGSERAWKASNEMKAFVSPWSESTFGKTIFKALYDEKFLYFLFEVEDKDIIMNTGKKSDEENAVISDRVELFFTANEEMNPYVTLEMDALGRIFDAAGIKPGKVDRKWNWPEDGIELQSELSDNGYSVEGKLSLSSMQNIGLIKRDTILCGIMRAEYRRGQTEQWITWIDPELKNPQFHHPNIFGRMILQKD